MVHSPDTEKGSELWNNNGIILLKNLRFTFDSLGCAWIVNRQLWIVNHELSIRGRGITVKIWRYVWIVNRKSSMVNCQSSVLGGRIHCWHFRVHVNCEPCIINCQPPLHRIDESEFRIHDSQLPCVARGMSLVEHKIENSIRYLPTLFKPPFMFVLD